jgi:hypothetical protein
MSEDQLVPYLVAIFLAVLTAVSELSGRFKDNPLRILVRRASIIYMIINATLAWIVLLLLRLASPHPWPLVALEQALLAGFGARLLARTKVVGVKTKDGAEHEIGPGTVIDQILATLSRSADRDQAEERLTITSALMKDVRLGPAAAMFVAEMAGSMQDLTDVEKQQIQTSIDVIQKRSDLDEATRVDLLGYLVLDYGGEEFLRKLVDLYWRRFPSGEEPRRADVATSAPALAEFDE